MLLAASVDEEGWLSIAFQDKRNLFLCVVEAGVTGRSYVALHIEQSEDEMIEFGSFSIDDAGFSSRLSWIFNLWRARALSLSTTRSIHSNVIRIEN